MIKDLNFEPKIVALGGGTGLSCLLRGLKEYTSNLTAIVTVTDDGGSSGKLRRELGILPPGDIRNCLVALSEEENLMTQLFQYRFPNVKSLSGHCFGNLFITAMSSLAGGFDLGVARASEVLAIRGRVLPATLRSVTLAAKLSNGKIIKGETKITSKGDKIEELLIHPSSPPAGPDVIEAIESSDCIVLGPGSLYTSIISNMLIDGVVDTLRKTKAIKIYVCNIMTQTRETSNYTLSDHLNALERYAGNGIIDYIIANSGKIPVSILKRYEKQNSYPVIIDKKNVKSAKIISSNLISTDEFARHEPRKLSNVIFKIILNNI